MPPCAALAGRRPLPPPKRGDKDGPHRQLRFLTYNVYNARGFPTSGGGVRNDEIDIAGLEAKKPKVW